MSKESVKDVVIIGAGPAGLTAAHALLEKNIKSVVLEQDSQVGGLAKTLQYKGYRFDIGGHRFFTQIPRIQKLWESWLGDEFKVRSRLSRIYYKGKFLNYPLSAGNIIEKLGIGFCITSAFSYFKAIIKPRKPVKTFEDWVINHFGEKLYKEFFKSYTEKVWGMPCNKLQATWAAQRIRGLSFFKAAKNALFKSGSDGSVKSLINQFHYPRLGPGQMWEVLTEKISSEGAEVHLNQKVGKITWKDNQITTVETVMDGKKQSYKSSHFLSSMPMRDLVNALHPAPPKEVQSAAECLGYRDFLIITLMVKQKDLCPDNWIYIHNEDVEVGRIQNFKNWSPDLVPDADVTSLGLEYFCFEGDALWSKSDEDLIEQGKQELETLGLASAADVFDGAVLRVKQAYPVYDEQYQEHVSTVQSYLAQFENLQLIGRNGMHKYNNQDHAMLTALLAVENLFGAEHDIWAINTAEEYHEETR